jgi:hypothetical protein
MSSSAPFRRGRERERADRVERRGVSFAGRNKQRLGGFHAVAQHYRLQHFDEPDGGIRMPGSGFLPSEHGEGRERRMAEARTAPSGSWAATSGSPAMSPLPGAQAIVVAAAARSSGSPQLCSTARNRSNSSGGQGKG